VPEPGERLLTSHPLIAAQALFNPQEEQ